MAVSEIPLSPENQRFSISVAGQSLQMAVTWRAAFWCLDIMDSTGADLIKGIPLITGANLLAQYRYLGLGFSLYVNCDDPANDSKRAARTVLTGMCYSVGSATRQGSSS
ncbi:phage baseplate plug family protein, partial [Klebsiella quasipneumoniae]|uniref:phage baseplate plug family protein n=1 Tax=Klebsiella quasipneumoniae TaxID=1463165 RepID=UPI003B20CF46